MDFRDKYDHYKSLITPERFGIFADGETWKLVGALAAFGALIYGATVVYETGHRRGQESVLSKCGQRIKVFQEGKYIVVCNTAYRRVEEVDLEKIVVE